MADDARAQEIEFPSADGRSTIRGTMWWPAGDAAPRAVVQLVHGMTEHIDRYDEFARWLAGAGFMVLGHDHLGHGRSCDPARWGCLPRKVGGEYLIADVGRARRYANDLVGADVPHFVFGHSLGSFVTRCYLGRAGTGLAGAVICGTGTVAPALTGLGKALTRAIAATRGEDHKSALIDALGAGAYARAIPDARTDFDWLSYDEANVDRYIADPACGFMFSVGAYDCVARLSAEACSAECASHVPHDLPLLYIAGDADPVGDDGRGVRAAAKLAEDAGSTDVTCVIYDHMRHEILNETGREGVYADVTHWIESHLPEEA